MVGKRFSSDDEVLARLRRLEHRVDAVQLGTGTTNVTNITETGVENFVELGDVPQTYASAAGELLYANAAEDGLEFNPYVTVSPTLPILTVRNLTDAEVDCVHQYAVGASPVVKWTHGLDDSDGDKWKLAVGDEFGDDHDTIVVTSGEGSTPVVAEFTLIDTWQTPISGASEYPAGGCTDGTYIYYTVYNPGALVKIDPVTGTEITRNTPANKIFKQIACDGTHLYVLEVWGGARYLEKYKCSDLSYVDTTGVIAETIAALFYWSGHLYCTDNSNGIRKVRCSDMSLTWKVSYPAGNPNECWPDGIATDGTYLYVLDDKSNGIIRLNMDGTWVDLVAVANPMQNDTLWISGQYLYVGVDTSRVEQLNKSDLSSVGLFGVAASAITQAFQRDGYHYLVSGDDTCVYKYTSTSTEAAGTSYLQIRLKDVYGLMFDVARFTGDGRFGVGTTIPSATIEAVGNIKATAGQFISTKATGTAPVVVSSTTVCTNLNAGLVDGYHHDQSLLIAASPTFVALNLSATSNQIVLQSAGVTGTITATPASSNKVWTLQDVTGTIYQTGGTDVAVADGGTGASTLADGGLVIGNAAGAVEVVAAGTTLQILVGGGAATAPVWGTDIPTAVTIGSAYIYRASGTDVPVTDGGTGASTFTDHGALYGQAANAIGATAEGATGTYLAGTTGNAPSFATLNQAAVVGLTTADGPSFAHLHIDSPTGGGSNGIRMTQVAEHATPSSSFIPIEFVVPISGLVGEYLATANNYVNAAVNLPADSIGILSEGPNGALSLIASSAGGSIRLTVGGYSSAYEQMRITSAGVIATGAVYRERKDGTGGVTTGAYQDSTIIVAAGEIYLVTLTEPTATNAVSPGPVCIVTRFGTGTDVHVLSAGTSFTVSCSATTSYAIRFTNGAGTTKYYTATMLKLY